MKYLHHIVILAACICAGILASCGHSASVPASFSEVDSQPTLYPDYNGVTVPSNIAPLNFAIEDEGDEYVTRFKVGTQEWVVGGQSVVIDADDWHDMKQAALASQAAISVEVFVEKGGQWSHLIPFAIKVSADEIDPYISYRLIAPSYVTYENLTINQRNLENFDETLIYGNMINTDEKDGQCINCHSYQNYDPNTLQFHVRQYKGGTVICHDGQIEKIDMKVEGSVSAGVYPTWHPTLPLIAYSTNHTGQTFHTYDVQKIEVQDTYSDLILYDVKAHEVMPLERDTNDLDCFPFWDPAGKYLYYCSAHYEQQDSTTTKELDLITHYEDVHYNLYRRSFDASKRSFGPRELVFDADTCSATLPRISPDGRYLMFTLADFGVFHIWHNTSELYMIDLQKSSFGGAQAQAGNQPQAGNQAQAGKQDQAGNQTQAGNQPQASGKNANLSVRCLTELNSPDVESYHSWSSNGKWVIFSSRRYDGNFTRPFIAHFNEDGTFDRPFELPQSDPRYHQQFLRSYNIPEFMKGPVTVRPQELAKVILGDSIKATKR